jgi:hypothetical protein
MERLFGIPRGDKSGLATLIALLALGEAVQRRTEGMSRPNPPTLPGVVVGVALVRELGYDIAGPWSRESPFFGTLMAFAIIGRATRVAARAPIRRGGALARQGIHTVAHRYGHLVRPNRPRPAK